MTRQNDNLFIVFVLLGGQIENRAAMLFNRFVAEPPVHLVTVHECVDLVLVVRVKEAAANAPWQDSEHFVLVTQINHHSERSRDGDPERIIESVNATVQGFARAGCRVRAAAGQAFPKPLRLMGLTNSI